MYRQKLNLPKQQSLKTDQIIGLGQRRDVEYFE